MESNVKTTFYHDVRKQIDKKFLRIFKSVDKQVTRNLAEGRIATRPSNSNGLWCCTLIPAVLVIYSLLYNVSQLYVLLACISVGLMAYCFLFIVFISVSCLVLKENIFGGCAASCLTSTLLLYAIQGQGLIFSLIYSILAVYSFSSMLRWSIVAFPKTFTIGEAMIVVQSLVLFGIMAITNIFFNMAAEVDDEMKFVNSVNFTLLSSVGIIVTALCILDDSQKNLATLGYIFSVAGTYALMILHVNVGVDCIIRIAEYVFLDQSKATLFFFWFCLAVISACVILIRTQLAVKASTVTRKTFHVLASMVFLSGILYDVHLMTLAAGFGFSLMILIEALRKSGIEPISSALQAAFDVYSDEKDVGCFAMTPMYLYVGLACPLFLVPKHPGYELELLSGVLSIGVGDTAASWFGSKYGFNKWSDGQKTLEGTLFNVLSQMAVVHALDMFSLLRVRNAIVRIAITAAISGLVEAKTDQVDNLVLPLVTMIAFQVTFIICY